MNISGSTSRKNYRYAAGSLCSIRRFLAISIISAACLGLLPCAAEEDAYNLYRSGNWQKAAKLFQEAVSRNYCDSRARYYLGDCYLHMGQTGLAAQQFTVCLSIGNDPAVLVCSRNALTKLGFNFGGGAAVVPPVSRGPANNPFDRQSVVPSAPLLSQSGFQFTPIIIQSSGYVEPKGTMDQLVGLSVLPAGSGIGQVAGAQGQRLDDQYLSRRKDILLRYENQLDQARRDASEQIRSTNDRAARDKSSVDRYIYYGNKRVANPDYSSQINQITQDAQNQVDSINLKLNADAMQILAGAQHELGQLDDTHANIVSQVNSKGGISKMTSIGTGMYVRNFINFGGDDSTSDSVSGPGSRTAAVTAAPQSLMAPPAMSLKSGARGVGQKLEKRVIKESREKDEINVWK